MLDIEMISSSRLKDGSYSLAGSIVAMPFVDAAMARQAAQLMAARAGCKGLVLAIHDDSQEGFVTLINRAFIMTQSPSFAYVAQDAFAGRNWLSLAQTALAANAAGLAALNDGKWAGRLASFGLVNRRWARSVYDGYLFHPEYQSHYGDTELSLIAEAQGALCYDPNAVLVEIDWRKDQTPTNKADKALFDARLKTGFDNRLTAAATARRASGPPQTMQRAR